MRTPPDFREDLHPDEIVRRPSRHPWLGAIAVAATVFAAGVLLRALSPATDRAQSPAPAAAAPAPQSPAHVAARAPERETR